MIVVKICVVRLDDETKVFVLIFKKVLGTLKGVEASKTCASLLDVLKHALLKL